MKTLIIRIGLLQTLIIGLFFGGKAQSTVVQFTITTIDGQEQTFPLTDQNRVWFENGTTLDLEVGDVILEYALADIRKITCAEYEGTEESSDPGMTIFPNPVHDVLTFRGLQGKQTISLYALDGRLIRSFEVSGSPSIDVSDLPIGLYLVKTQTQTLKMIKL